MADGRRTTSPEAIAVGVRFLFYWDTAIGKGA
jgi:hypothetical protein